MTALLHGHATDGAALFELRRLRKTKRREKFPETLVKIRGRKLELKNGEKQCGCVAGTGGQNVQPKEGRPISLHGRGVQRSLFHASVPAAGPGEDKDASASHHSPSVPVSGKERISVFGTTESKRVGKRLRVDVWAFARGEEV